MECRSADLNILQDVSIPFCVCKNYHVGGGGLCM